MFANFISTFLVCSVSSANLPKSSLRRSKPIRVCSSRAFSRVPRRSSTDWGVRSRGDGHFVGRDWPPGEGDVFRTKRLGGEAVLAVRLAEVDTASRLAEVGLTRPSRFSGLSRRPGGTSGENVNVSSEDSRERERTSVSLPRALARLSADVARRWRPLWEGGGAAPYSRPVIPRLPVAIPGIMAVADGACNVLGITPAARGGRAAVTEGPAALP